MFKKIFSQPVNDKPVRAETTKKYNNSYIAETTEVLLNRQKEKLSDIKMSLSMSENIYSSFYLQMFSNLVMLAQCVPASESHHHSHKYGYIDHVFECVVLSLRQREGYVYRSEREDLIMKKKDVFTFACVVSALCHDLGKLITDIEFFNVTTGKPQDLISEPLEPGTEYIFRFYPGRNKEDHKAAGLLLFRNVITASGLDWVQQEPGLFRELLHCLSGNHALSGKVGEITLKADRFSTSSNIGSVASKFSVSTPTNAVSSHLSNQMDNEQLQKTTSNINSNNRAVEIISALMSCIQNHEMYANGKKIGSKGGFAWITKDSVYVVNPRCFELINGALKASQSQIKLTQATVCYSILGDAGFINKNNGLYYSYCTIDKDNWNKKLPLVRFYRDKIDPEYLLPESSMKVVSPEDEDTEEKYTKEKATEHSEKYLDEDSDKAMPFSSSTSEVLSQNTTVSTISIVSDLTGQVPEEKVLVEKTSEEKREMNAFSEAFFKWLKVKFKSKGIDVNKKNAPVHIVNGKICLVSPAIFKIFLDDKASERILNSCNIPVEENSHEMTKKLQYELFENKVHYRDQNMGNILNFRVQGNRNAKSRLAGILLLEEMNLLLLENSMNNSREVYLSSVILD